MSTYIGRGKTEPHPPHLSEVHPGVFYVDLCQITSEELNPTSSFMSAILHHGRAFICDVRGYPTGAALEFIRHLSNNDSTGVQCTTLNVSHPDRVGAEEGPVEQLECLLFFLCLRICILCS